MEHTKKVEDKLREIVSNCRYDKFTSEQEDSLNIYELLITICQNMPGSRQKEAAVQEAVIEMALHFIVYQYNQDWTDIKISEFIDTLNEYLIRYNTKKD